MGGHYFQRSVIPDTTPSFSHFQEKADPVVELAFLSFLFVSLTGYSQTMSPNEK